VTVENTSPIATDVLVKAFKYDAITFETVEK
jgi:hypothetical protein